MRDLTVYRLDIAKHRTEVSKSLLDDGHYQDSINVLTTQYLQQCEHCWQKRRSISRNILP